MKLGSLLSIVFLGVVSLAHLARLILQIPVQIGPFQVPQWMSLAAFLFCAGLAVSLHLETRVK